MQRGNMSELGRRGGARQFKFASQRGRSIWREPRTCGEEEQALVGLGGRLSGAKAAKQSGCQAARLQTGAGRGS